MVTILQNLNPINSLLAEETIVNNVPRFADVNTITVYIMMRLCKGIEILIQNSE